MLNIAQNRNDLPSIRLVLFTSFSRIRHDEHESADRSNILCLAVHIWAVVLDKVFVCTRKLCVKILQSACRVDTLLFDIDGPQRNRQEATVISSRMVSLQRRLGMYRGRCA